MPPTRETKIALIICSTRTPRIGPSIASWLTSLLSPEILGPNTTLSTIDLDPILPTLPLSISGNVIPASIPFPFTSASPYSDAAVNQWSQIISSFQGFILLTPQYNWSFPGSVKIAFDHLFYEWKGKPALVVSYGGRGGGRANAGLREVLKGLRAAPMEKGVELSISGDKGEGMKAAEKEGRLVDTVKEGWKMDRKEEEVVDAVRELVALISKEG